MNFRLEVKCEGGHVQELELKGVPTTEWMRAYCALLDGTSPAYVRKPCDDPASVIGKCGICQKQVKARFYLSVESSKN